MKKRALINLIGVFIVVALVITAWVLFPDKVRIGYYKQLDANGQFYKIDNNNEKRVYIYDKNKKEHMPFLNVYCDDVMIYNWTCSGLTLPVDYFRPAGMYTKKLVYFGNSFLFPTYSDKGDVNTIYCKFSDKYITLTDLRGQKITYKWIGLLCNSYDYKKSEYTTKYGQDILNNSEELSLKEIKANRNKRIIFYGIDVFVLAGLIFYNIYFGKNNKQK